MPLIPASLLAMIVWGLGMLSLAPLFAALVIWRATKHAAAVVEDPVQWKGDWRRGLALGVLILLGLELGPLVTRVNLMRAMSPDADRAESGVAWLRTYHSENALLRAW